jgi:hypothetical protein
MKARRYYTLLIKDLCIDIEDRKWEIHFGDYDRDVVEEEQYEFQGTVASEEFETTIISTKEDQSSINSRVDTINRCEAVKLAQLTERTIKIPTKSVYHQPNHEQREIDTLAHVAQAYLVIWFRDETVEVYNRNYQLISKDPDVAWSALEHKDEYRDDRDAHYPSPASGRYGSARWFHSDPDIIHFIKPSDELVRA